MSNDNSIRAEHIFRVDKFVVPTNARDEFLSMVRMTHEFLKTLPGLVQDFVLEQSSGLGEFNFVTFAEWETAAAIESAKSALMARYREMNLNPEEMLGRLGIKADMGNYNLVPNKEPSNVKASAKTERKAL